MFKRALDQLKILKKINRVTGVNEFMIDRLLSKF